MSQYKNKVKSESGWSQAEPAAGGGRGQSLAGAGPEPAAARNLATGAAGDVTGRRRPCPPLLWAARAGGAACLLLPGAPMRSPRRAAGCPRAPNKSTPRRAPASHDLMAPRDGAGR